VDAPRRNPELIYKTLKAAFADTLKKKLNVENPATVADLEMMNDGGQHSPGDRVERRGAADG